MAENNEKTTNEDERVETERVVLIAAEVPLSALGDEVAAHFRRKRNKPESVVVWVPIAESKGGKSAVIHAAAKTAAHGSLEEAPGTYRAPSLRSWKGGEKLSAPPQMKLDREAID